MIFNTRDGSGSVPLVGWVSFSIPAREEGVCLLSAEYRFRYLRGCGAIGFFGCGDSYPYHGATGLRVIKG